MTRWRPRGPRPGRKSLIRRCRPAGFRSPALHLSRALLAVALLLLSACGGDAGDDNPADPRAPLDAMAAGSGRFSVDQLTARLASDPAGMAASVVDVVAYVNAPAGQGGEGVAPPRGCPVVPSRLPLLTDEPFKSELTVAGATLPSPAPDGMGVLLLAIPYELGFVDLPARGVLRGRVLDPAYSGCPDAERLFVLETVVEAIPAEPVEAMAPVAAEIQGGWETWRDPEIGLRLPYPAGWMVEERRNVGSLVDARFSAPDSARSIQLSVLSGKTYWRPAVASVPPPALRGERRVPVTVGGGVDARLVDAQLTGGGEPVRELRIVLNYDGKTVLLQTRFPLSAPPDEGLLEIFSRLAQGLEFERPLGVTDPLDPVVTARSELGSGPFIDQASAEYIARSVSGLLQAAVLEARLVSELEARTMVPGSCRTFQERPEGVWLVLVEGVAVAGGDARRLVYVDATTGQRLCQADAVRQ